jgi:hypothetical protein
VRHPRPGSMPGRKLAADDQALEKATISQEDLAKRVTDLEATLAAITSTLNETPESAAQVNLGKAVERGKATIDEAMRSGEWDPVDAVLESFMLRARFVQRAEAEQVDHAVKELLRAHLEELRTLTRMDRPPQLTEVVDRVTGKITSSDGGAGPALGSLVLAGALVFAALTAGAAIPLLLPTATAAESVLTNEVAIVAVAVSVATLIKDR